MLPATRSFRPAVLELESRLIELGFVEGVQVAILYEGIVGRDPIAIRVGNVTVAVSVPALNAATYS